MYDDERSETYKHLEDRVRLGAFTLGQWASLFVMALLGAMFGLYWSPLPTKPTIVVSVWLAGGPVLVAYALEGREFDVWRTLCAIWVWARGEKHYLPGGGPVPEAGYVVQAPAPVERPEPRSPADAAALTNRLEEVWHG